MSEGPTTVGSIVGRLKLDASEWDAELTKAGVKADELGRKNPTIRVDADVAAALAKLEAIQAASDRVGGTSAAITAPTGASASGSVSAGASARVDALAAAERRLALAVSASDSATARAIVAEMKFEESRKKRGRTAAQVAAAELALAEAINRADNAASRAVFAEESLAASQRKAAEAALLEAAAQETSTVATTKANQANSTNVSRVGMIAAAVAALVPMMVPLAAFTIGAAGALTMMGVSGILAVKGIKDEMAQGTAVGQQYTAGLGALKSDLDVLAQTAAVGMLSSFKGITSELNASMPMLNAQVGAFTGFLGRTGSNLFSGAITGVRVLEPLMVSISGWVERLSAGFKSWTQNGGLQAFTGYAMATLPQVEATLSAVATAVMHILAALAPLGSVGLTVLTAVSQGISGLPVQTLSDLIAGLTAAFFAFKAWGLIAPILASVTEAAALATNSIGLLGVSVEIASGPIGWIVAGVGALVAVLAVSASSANAASNATNSYTTALQISNGAIDDSVRAVAVKTLTDNGAIAAAIKLGISTKLVTDAALGNVPAQQAMTKAMGAASDKADLLKVAGWGLTDSQKTVKDSLATLTSGYGDNVASLSAAKEANAQYDAAMGKTSGSTGAQTQAVDALAKKYGMTTAAYIAATTTQQTTAAQLATTTQAMFIQGDAAGLLKQSLDLLNGKTLSAAGTQNTFDSALSGMATHLNATTGNIDDTLTSLDGMSASAVANRGELIRLTGAAEANAQAFRDNGGSAADTKQKLIDMKQAIEDNAVAHGENRAAVHLYLDELYKIPDSIPATKVEVDTADAEAKLHSLVGYFTNNPVVLRVADGSGSMLMANGKSAPGSSDGSTIGGAGSSSIDSVPMMLAPGEEVISNKSGQAARYRPLLKQINAGMVPSLPSSSNTSSGSGTGGGTGGNVAVTIINKAGAALADLIDVRIQTASGLRKIDLSTGLQKAAY